MQVMVPYLFKDFVNHLLSLVESGEVSMARIDDAVERILRVKFVAGLFEHPYSDESLLDSVNCKVSFFHNLTVSSLLSPPIVASDL